MLAKSLYEVIPLRPIFWRSYVGLVPKGMNGIRHCQFSRHEAQLNERFYAVREQAVINLVHIRKVIDGVLLAVFIVQANFVVKNGMKTDIHEVGDLFDLTQVLAIALT